jgi:hypothetical protein
MFLRQFPERDRNMFAECTLENMFIDLCKLLIALLGVRICKEFTLNLIFWFYQEISMLLEYFFSAMSPIKSKNLHTCFVNIGGKK